MRCFGMCCNQCRYRCPNGENDLSQQSKAKSKPAIAESWQRFIPTISGTLRHGSPCVGFVNKESVRD